MDRLHFFVLDVCDKMATTKILLLVFIIFVNNCFKLFACWTDIRIRTTNTTLCDPPPLLLAPAFPVQPSRRDERHAN